MTRHFSIGVALLLLVGCAATPDNRYYTLSVERPAAGAPAPARSALTLASVRLPGVTDRPQLVVRTGAQTVNIEEFDRWAEPFSDMVTRILAQDLAVRLGPSARGEPEIRVFVVIDEFMADTTGPARLAGHWWTLAPGEDASRKRERSFSLTEPADTNQNTQIAAAMSALLGKLADEVVRN